MQIQAQAVPAVGTPAPDFTLFSHDKKEISLSGLRGRKVVLLFYPQAFTSVCTTELCDMRDNLNRYTALDADVFGISVDSPFTLYLQRGERGESWRLAQPSPPAEEAEPDWFTYPLPLPGERSSPLPRAGAAAG